MATAIEAFARAAGAVATTRDVGAYVTELLGAHGSARRHALRKAVRAAETGGLRDTDPQPAPPQIDDVAPHSYSRPPSLMLTARRFPKWPWAIAAGLALATGTYLLARHRSSDAPAAASATPPAVTASMSPPELPILACTAAPVDEPADPSPRTNDVRRAVPPPSKRPFIAPKRAHHQATPDPDVGF
jgi:hypothetical protein